MTTVIHARKISIIGISGSGKSTFARELAADTRLPLFHMDTLFWRGNWVAVPAAEYLRAHRDLIARDTWIIEGYIDETLAERVNASDLVIYLDYSGLRCAWRVLKRWAAHCRESRPELPVEAHERISLRFLWTVLSRAERPAIEAALRGVDHARVRRVTSPRQLIRLIHDESSAPGIAEALG